MADDYQRVSSSSSPQDPVDSPHPSPDADATDAAPQQPPRASSFSDDGSSSSDAAEPASRMFPRSRRGPSGGDGADPNAAWAAAFGAAAGTTPDRQQNKSLYHQEPVWPPPPMGQANDLFGNSAALRRRANPASGGAVRAEGGDLRGSRANARSGASDGGRYGNAADADNGAGVAGFKGDPYFAVDNASDDEDDDYDSEIVASSFIRRSAGEYTKLETMSSQQIRRVLNVYHIFLLLALFVTIGLVITENVAYRRRPLFALPLPVPGLFSEELFRQGFREDAAFRRSFVDGTNNGEGASRREEILGGGQGAQNLVASFEGTTQDVPATTGRALTNSDDKLLHDFLASRNLYLCDPSEFCDVCTGNLASVLESFDTRLDFLEEYPNAKPTYLGYNRDPPVPKPALCTSRSVARVALRGLNLYGAAGKRGLDVSRQAVDRKSTCENLRKLGRDCNNATEDAGVAAPTGGEPVLPAKGSSDEAWEKFAMDNANFAIKDGRGPDDPNPASMRRLTIFNLDLKFQIALHSLNFAASVIAAVAAMVFIVRIVRLGRMRITHEQIWAALLLVLAALYWNAWDSLDRIDRTNVTIKTNNGIQAELFLPEWYHKVQNIMTAAREPAFSGIVFFYVWANLHTYRILDPTKHLSLVTFYLPKLAIVFPYVLFKSLARPAMNLYLSEIPLLSMIVWVRHFYFFRVWNALRSELLYSVGAAVMELILIGVIIAEAFTTNSVLRRAKYNKYRTKQVGFRFFVYMNVTFFVSSAVLHLMVVFSLPNGAVVLLLNARTVWLTSTFDMLTGPSILLFGYALTEAYVKLPRHAVGAVKGWFVDSKLAPSSSRWSRSSRDSAPASCSAFDEDEGVNSRLVDSSENPSLALPSLDGSSLAEGNSDTEGSEASPASGKKMPKFIVDQDDELNLEIVEPVRYRKRESSEHLELKANSFIMETHVMMFNFAWYVYYYGTAKAKKVSPSQESRFSVFSHIKSEETDTHALVIDGSDRIVVSFKGTTSMRNMQTSIQIYHEHLKSVVPSEEENGVEEAERMQRLFGRSYSNAKVHKGFAAAYRSVAPEVMKAVRTLLEKKKRPVFLTGHSLGGALATLCSLDCWLKLNLSRRELLVSTFGSPRVGNDSFREVYSSAVPLHWRIVVVPDLVTKLPKVGYKHVGKKVILTTYGRMLIDPSMLDNLHWSSNSSAAFAHHRKASYLLAMRAYCARNHGSKFTPAFWAFPVSADDKRRFGVVHEDSRKSKVPSRLIELDALVDALGSNDDGDETDGAEIEEPADRAVELWSRLARRALLNATLRS